MCATIYLPGMALPMPQKHPISAHNTIGPGHASTSIPKARRGHVDVIIHIDEPDLVRYGPGSTVTGLLKLQYTPGTATSPETELSGTFRISLDFFGEMTIKTSIQYAPKTKIFFTQTQRIHHGHLNLEEGQWNAFPFAFVFPEAGRNAPQIQRGSISIDNMGSEPLPPSFQIQFDGRRNDEQRVTEVETEYRLQPRVQISGANVDVRMLAEPRIEYCPRDPGAAMGAAGMQSCLLDSDGPMEVKYKPGSSKEPHSHGGGLMSRFTNRHSTFVFDLQARLPEVIIPGQPVLVDLEVLPCSPKSGPEPWPEVTFSEVSLQLVEQISLYVRSGKARQQEKTITTDLGPMEMLSNHASTRNVQTLRPLEFEQFKPAFNFRGVERRYGLRVQARINVAGTSRDFDRWVPVKIQRARHAKAGAHGSSGEYKAVEAGAADRDEDDETPPPAYEEAGTFYNDT